MSFIKYFGNHWLWASCEEFAVMRCLANWTKSSRCFQTACWFKAAVNITNLRIKAMITITNKFTLASISCHHAFKFQIKIILYWTTNELLCMLSNDFRFVSSLTHVIANMNHREHTILPSRERVDKGTKRINSLPSSPILTSYTTLQRKPLLTSTA